jgi:hypothetical protein
MNDAYAQAMQVKLCKGNTWGVTLRDCSSLIMEFDFLCWGERTIIAYNMDSGKVHLIPALAIRYGRCSVLPEKFISRPYYLPYIPLFSKKLAEE